MFAEDRGASSAAAARACATRRWISRSSNERAFLSACDASARVRGEGSVRRRERGGFDGEGRRVGRRRRRGRARGRVAEPCDELHAVAGVSSGDSPRSRRRRSYPDAASTSAIASPGDPSPPARPSRSRRRAARRSGPRGPPTRNEFFARRVAADFPSQSGGRVDVRSNVDRDLRFPDAAARLNSEVSNLSSGRDGTRGDLMPICRARPFVRDASHRRHADSRDAHLTGQHASIARG